MAEIVRELVEKRDLYSKHYLNDDGTITAEIHSYPIHYKTETGEYDDIDLTIIPERNWEFEYALKKNTIRAYFNDAADIENFTLVGVELINNQGVARWMTFKMLDATPTDSSYEGNRFKYHNVFPNVDLEYTVTPEKLKENIIVHDPSALQPFTFSLKLDDGLEMQLQPNNDIHFIDKETGEKLWEIQVPFAVDSSEERKRTNNVVYTLGKAVYQGVEYDTITVEIHDDKFLANAVYPIEIDPTVTIQPEREEAKDTYIYSGSVNSNYGGATSLYIGFSRIGEYRTLVQFDLSSIPEGSVIQSARLLMRIRTYSALKHVYIHKITSSWEESTVTWNTRPSYDEKHTDYILRSNSTTDPDGWDGWDVTSDIPDMLSGNNYGWMFIMDGGTETTRIYYSSDDPDPSRNPKLEVTYNAPQTGTFKIKTPSGILTLPIYDPNVGMTGKNQLRIQTPRGIGCFELVDITDPNASPLRVYTPSGVKAIAKQ